jgi:signal transduction histidine kinase
MMTMAGQSPRQAARVREAIAGDIAEAGAGIAADAELLRHAAVVVVLCAALYATTLVSYILFHSVVELTTIAIGLGTFVLVWNARRFLPDDSLTILGVGYAFSAIIDLVHTLAYKGMGVFPGQGANLPTQLWVAARGLQAASLVVAGMTAGRRADLRAVLAAHAGAVAALLALVSAGRFPTCYVDGAGLTRFKIASEYLICAALLGALWLFHRSRARRDPGVQALVAAALACSAVAELAFTSYVSVYAFSNALGHLFKFAGYYLIYRALVVTGLQHPFDLIFRDLKRAEDRLRLAQEGLETQVRARTAELRESERRYRMVFENSPVSIWEEDFSAVKRLLDGLRAEGIADLGAYLRDHPDVLRRCAESARIVDVNRAALTLHGARTKEELLAGLVHTFTPESFDTFREELVTLWEGRTELSRDAAVRTLGGDPRSVTVHFAVCPGYEATLSRVVVSLTDVTKRRLAEEEVRRLNRELEARVLERTAALEDANRELEAFAYSVSHDLRAPLRHVAGFAERLTAHAGGSLDERGRHYLQSISAAAGRMGTLIDDLLSFSRMGRSEMTEEPVSLAALAQEVIAELAPDAGDRDVRWTTAELPTVRCDRAMLRVALLNLVANALKFTRPRAVAEIELGWRRGEQGEVVVFVRDNGVGFDPEYAGKLFVVFQRLHRAEEFEGTGIGLAIVRRIVARHGGRTWAEGALDRGATFYLSLPQLSPPERRPEKAAAPVLPG